VFHELKLRAVRNAGHEAVGRFAVRPGEGVPSPSFERCETT
jgi:hypothetical protein